MKNCASLLILTVILVSGAVLAPAGLCGQEYLTGVCRNPVIAGQASSSRSPKSVPDAVKLPFLEDFSGHTGYPDPSLWCDRMAFVNSTFPLCPPTVGVATLDALDAAGRVYAFANCESFAADTLTSAPIRLDSNFTLHRPMRLSDSIYFSFYYQPGGGRRGLSAHEWERVGDGPEPDDRLILEFGYATGRTVFTGYEYGEYVIGDGESYQAGDTMENPYMPGEYHIFESAAYSGQTILIPVDSLFGPEYVWNRVWDTEGCRLDEWLAENPLRYFRQVLIPVDDIQYLRDNFQFRFRNTASLDMDMPGQNAFAGWAGNCDQWHIDYVQLNTDRNAADLYPNDVAFVSPTTTALNGYQAMPWNQYRPENMAASFHNDLSNLAATAKNTSYRYKVVKNGVAEVYSSTPNNENAAPYYPGGLHSYPYHAEPPVNFSYVYDGADSALFTITHVFSMTGANDACLRNDTCIFEQKFYNYYAYDDGTAEAGYCLLSTLSPPRACLAVRFAPAEPDTLRCVNIWFNRTLDDASVAPFTLTVWDSRDGCPGDVLYEMPAQLPAYGDGRPDFTSYCTEEPVPVADTFYVGICQNHDVQLNVGFDQNNDARGNFLYKVADEWKEPFLKGAPMIRPVLGKALSHSGTAQHGPASRKICPNPTAGLVHVENDGEAGPAEYRLLDLYGRVLKAGRLNGNTLDLRQLPAGLYVLKITGDAQTTTTHKIIKK